MRKIRITHPEDSTKTKAVPIGEKESGAINLHFSAWTYRYNYIETSTTKILLRSARPFPYKFTIADSNNYYFGWIEVTDFNIEDCD
jgi:hypothetical protein